MKNENAKIIAELMNKYNEYSEKWSKKNNGNMEGFDAWFTKQVYK